MVFVGRGLDSFKEGMELVPSKERRKDNRRLVELVLDQTPNRA